MATIVLSEEAPQDEPITFSLAGAEPFEAPFESDNPTLLANAEAHPWLQVEHDEADLVEASAFEPSVDPTQDPLSAQYEGEVTKDSPAVEDQGTPLAVEAGLDQNESVTVGEGREVAVTLAADEDNYDDGEQN